MITDIRIFMILKIQPLCNCLEFIIGDAQVPFGVCDTHVIKLVHDQSQVDPLHTGMVSPGFSQTVGTEIAWQSHLAAD
jgi:hypothetical protein